MLVVANNLGIVPFEVTAIGSHEVVFRMDTVDISRLMEVFVGAGGAVSHDGFSAFVFS